MSPSEPVPASRWERLWARVEPALLKGWDSLLFFALIALHALWRA